MPSEKHGGMTHSIECWNGKYKLYRKNRLGRRGSGVGLYFRESLMVLSLMVVTIRLSIYG